MATRPEAILYSILDRCSAAGGCAVDARDPIVVVFLRRGLLAMCQGGTAVETTAKGREAMRLVFGARARNNPGC
jgi:hypothetical protein